MYLKLCKPFNGIRRGVARLILTICSQLCGAQCRAHLRVEPFMLERLQWALFVSKNFGPSDYFNPSLVGPKFTIFLPLFRILLREFFPYFVYSIQQ